MSPKTKTPTAAGTGRTRTTRDSITKVDVKDLALRQQTSGFLLANPNYFGTVKDSPFPAVQTLSGSTAFEEVRCVGLNPTIDQLEAVVSIKQTGGYAGPLCSKGSTEYVRFHVSYDNKATWVDAGGDSFTVHDSTGTRPLDFAVNVVAPLNHRWCIIGNQPVVRAILSWNHAPTPGDADFTPVWGNVLDVIVQPTGSTFPPIWEFLEVTKVKLTDTVAAQLDLDAPVALKAAQPLTVHELVLTYANTDVEPHRYLFPTVAHALDHPDFLAPAAVAQAAVKVGPLDVNGAPIQKVPPTLNLSEIVKAQIDWSTIVGLLLQTDGDTSFEELGCVGYDPVEDALVGVLSVKKPNGYSGGPCTAGSTEYVAFWVDWGTGWSYAGTAGVTVHDETIPATGLQYAVYLPLGSSAHRTSCSTGAVEPKVRAILSWQSPPPPANPDWVPTWGNREETTIQLPIGAVSALAPVVDYLSGVHVCDIDQGDGRTTSGDNPFGGVVTISGFIPDAPDVAAPQMRYRVRVRQAGTVPWTTLTTPFQVSGTEWTGTVFPQPYSLTQVPGPDDFFPYLVDRNLAGAGYRTVYGDVLYPWATAAPMTGLWEVEVVAKDAGGTLYPAQTILCSDGTARATVKVRLDELVPDVTLAITEVIHADGTSEPTGACKKFTIGDTLKGTYAVSDEHFGQTWFELEPAASALGLVPTFSGSTAYPAVLTTANGTWTLDTSGMASCGYVLTLWAQDRTIAPSGPWRNRDLFGFSLEG